MSRVTRAGQEAQQPYDATQKQEEAIKENLLGSAFDSIFEIYPNEEAVSKALKEAKDKVARYADERRAITLGSASRDQIVNNIKAELVRLEENVDHKSKFRVSRYNSLFRSVGESQSESEFVRETMAVITSFVEKAEDAAQAIEKEKQLVVDEEKAEKLVGMLEIAKLAVRARGTKRRSDEALDDEVEVVDVRAKRHRSLRERK